MVDERQQLREAVAKLASAPLTDERWAAVNEIGTAEATIANIKQGRGRITAQHPSVRALAGWHDSLHAAYRNGRGLPAPQQDGARMLARSYVFAAMVEQDTRVIEFREGAPIGVLLPSLEEAERWIREQAARDEAYAREMLGAPLPGGRLYFQAPASGKLVDSVYTYPGTTLNELRELVQWVVFLWPWTIFDALSFILTGTVPLLPDVTATLDYVMNADAPGAWRINLRIDPGTPPSEVAAWYEQEREKLLGLSARGKRAKRLQLKHARLATFWGVVQRAAFTVAEQMKLWNLMSPAEQQYAPTRERTFHRDVRRAVEGILRPAYLKDMNVDAVEQRLRGEGGSDGTAGES